ncbi:hypothetical protein CAC42_1716 [Sphaceloma murrayae]|uniref:Uncharacterized protein n=1 Tax=Sphaceloma murrayae TaxID=2082308 RepID=A0A2K1QHS0_9PEZI|nr:hypothetical protein CAC42_1716 [Sphaceloma murrayae]
MKFLSGLLLLASLAVAAPGPNAAPNPDAVAEAEAAPIALADYSEVFSLEKRQYCGNCNRECCRKRPSGNCDSGGISCGRSYCDSNPSGYFCRCVCGYGK